MAKKTRKTKVADAPKLWRRSAGTSNPPSLPPSPKGYGETSKLRRTRCVKTMAKRVKTVAKQYQNYA